MIHTETITLNGKQYDRTYSDTYYIERDGAQYTEAVDPLNSGRQYTETDIPLPTPELTKEQEYLGYLQQLGVDVSEAETSS